MFFNHKSLVYLSTLIQEREREGEEKKKQIHTYILIIPLYLCVTLFSIYERTSSFIRCKLLLGTCNKNLYQLHLTIKFFFTCYYCCGCVLSSVFLLFFGKKKMKTPFFVGFSNKFMTF